MPALTFLRAASSLATEVSAGQLESALWPMKVTLAVPFTVLSCSQKLHISLGISVTSESAKENVVLDRLDLLAADRYCCESPTLKYLAEVVFRSSTRFQFSGESVSVPYTVYMREG